MRAQCFRVLLVVACAAFLVAGPGAAQNATDPLAQEFLRALQQRGSGAQALDPSVQSTVQLQMPQSNGATLPAVPANPLAQFPAVPPQGLSALERVMSLRTGQRVQQYGYDMFGRAVVTRQSGTVQDNYILGEGDEIVVGLTGQEAANYRVRVDRDGRVTLPRLPPIAAAGRSFGAFRADLEAAVAKAYIGTQLSASVGAVRQVAVRVVGEVNAPGLYNLTGLSSALDALNLAGGVKKSGSLRDIRVQRRGATLRLDLYAVLTGGAGGDITLADGDRVIVPLLGHAAAVVGQVKRPAIYELPPGERQIRVADLLALAGGPQLSGAYSYSLLQQRPDGRREMTAVSLDSATRVLDGDALFVKSNLDVSLARVEVMGAVATGGYVALATAPSLKALLGSADVFAPQLGKPLPYMLAAVVLRLDRQTMQRLALPFSPAEVIAGKGDMPLQSDDLVYILNTAEMRYIAGAAARTAAQEAERSGVETDRTQVAQPRAGTAPSPAMLQTMPGAAVSPAQGAVLAAAAGSTASRAPASTQSRSRTGPVDAEADVGPFALPDSQTLPRLNGIAAPRPNDEGKALGEGLEDDADALDREDTVLDAADARTTNPSRRNLSAPRERLFVGLDDDQRRLLIRTLSNYYVLLSGEVTDPGPYLVLPQTSLDKVVQAAGGVTPNIDLSGFEVSSADVNNASGTSQTVRRTYRLGTAQFSQVALKPLDRVRFNKVFSDRAGEVALHGEIRFPGGYEVTRSEKLSSVLARAGGLTDAAYPQGAIFLRRSVAEQERGVLRREADALESQLIGLMGSVSTARAQISESEIQYVTQMMNRLRQAEGQGGRIAVAVDMREIAAHPELDITLEPGDQLYIPRKPSSVVVAGEVMSPSGIQFKAGMKVKDYLARAGGVTEVADEDHIFVIQPDGSAVLAEGDSWLDEEPALAPGSVIVVPRTLKPFSWDVLLQTAIQVVSQLSLTAASIAVIGR